MIPETVLVFDSLKQTVTVVCWVWSEKGESEALYDDAIKRIDEFHVAGKPRSVNMETTPGLRCEARYLPITPVGLYVPGGSAPLISFSMAAVQWPQLMSGMWNVVILEFLFELL